MNKVGTQKADVKATLAKYASFLQSCAAQVQAINDLISEDDNQTMDIQGETHMIMISGETTGIDKEEDDDEEEQSNRTM